HYIASLASVRLCSADLLSSLFPPPPTSTLFPYTTLFRSPLRPAPSEGVARSAGLRRLHVLHIRQPLEGTFGEEAEAEKQCDGDQDRKSTRLNSSHVKSSYAVFCLKKKNKARKQITVKSDA